MISVVIPVYNGEKTIGRAVESALAQNVDKEIIVLDDCSTDGTASVLQPYMEQQKIRYVRNENNCGVAETRNRGVALAKGEYVAFLDSDDSWLEGKLAAQLKRLAETNHVICSTARQLCCPGSAKDGQIIHMPDRITYRELLGCNSIACSSVLIRTDVAKEFPMVCDAVHEDYLTWIKVLRKYRYCSGIDVPYLQYTLSTTGKSGSKLNSARMTFGVYRKAGLSFVHSCICFVRYAFHGVWNYYGPRKRQVNRSCENGS